MIFTSCFRLVRLTLARCRIERLVGLVASRRTAIAVFSTSFPRFLQTYGYTDTQVCGFCLASKWLTVMSVNRPQKYFIYEFPIGQKVF